MTCLMNKVFLNKSSYSQVRQLCYVLMIWSLFSCSSMMVADNANESAESTNYTLNDELLFQLLAGEFAGNSGDLEASVAYYQQAAENTEDSRVAARATYIALYGKQYEQSLQALERWYELEPENEDINRMYAITYIKLQQPQNATPYIEKILANYEGSDKEKALAVKRLLQKEAENKDGLVILDALNLSQPGNIHMMILQARYAAQLEHYDDAVALLDQVLQIEPELSDVFIIKSRILEAQGKHQASMSLILKVLEQQPENSTLRMQYARMLVEDREFDAALEQFTILHDQNEDDSEVLISLALLHIETRQLEQAKVHLEKLIRIGKKIDISHYYLGRISQNQDQHEVAIEHYQNVKNGNYVFEAKLRISALLARLERPDEAIEQLNRLAAGTSAWPDKVRAYLAIGEVMRSQRRYAEAFELYTTALEQSPEDPDLLYARALTAEKVDRVDITESDLLKVLSTEPENANALNALGYTLADRTERLQEALEYIKRAAALVPDDAAILDSLGWVSYRLGRMQDALKWLGMAFEKLEDAEIAAHYGEVLWQSNQREQARKVWEKGQAADATHPVLIETLKRFRQ